MKKVVKILSVLLTMSVIVTAFVMNAEAAQFQGESRKKVLLGGQPFGVKFYNSGVIVIQLEEFFDGTRYVCPAKEGGVQVNDIIKKVNGRSVNSNEDIQSASLGSDGKAIELTLEREGKNISAKVTPAKNMAGAYLLGAWIRDSSAGIGTLTYCDTDEGYFAALGHGICDNDTLALLPLGSAEVVEVSINSVTKSVSGSAGSLNGYFTDNQIGELVKNTDTGIYGKSENGLFRSGQTVEVADKSEAELGKAMLYTTIENDKIGCYEIEITKFCDFSSKNNENFVIKITSKELIDKCGGIVQGMSGSPIVQNGKLLGAVTHVFLNKPDEGYGVLAQNMGENYSV